MTTKVYIFGVVFAWLAISLARAAPAPTNARFLEALNDDGRAGRGSSSGGGCYRAVVETYLSVKGREGRRRNGDAAPGGNLCEDMTESDQHGIAFMLASCHYMESGRPMRGVDDSIMNSECDFIAPPLEDSDSKAVVVKSEVVAPYFEAGKTSCTTRMTGDEFGVYTQFKVNIGRICDELTSEYWRDLNGKHIAALSDVSGVVSEQLQASAEKTDSALQMQTELLIKTDAHLRITDEHLKLTDGLFVTIEERHTETIGKIASTHEEALMKARETAAAVDAVQASVLQTTSTLQNLMENAIESIDIIENFANNAWVYVHRMATASHFLALINAAWILTSTNPTKVARIKLFVIAGFNALVEYLIGAAVNKGKVNEEMKMKLVMNVRTWCLLFCGLIFADCLRCWMVERWKEWWSGEDYREEDEVGDDRGRSRSRERSRGGRGRGVSLTRQDLHAVGEMINIAVKGGGNPIEFVDQNEEVVEEVEKVEEIVERPSRSSARKPKPQEEETTKESKKRFFDSIDSTSSTTSSQNRTTRQRLSENSSDSASNSDMEVEIVEQTKGSQGKKKTEKKSQPFKNKQRASTRRSTRGSK
ncbi:hypothetical protein TrLO_g11195 [Triparma laevis f. longispina]|uniref:Uncharacterized protein n=1 Tax=Triparma laevis f. longispina TaxID=1714387 RepID=A0A9W7FB27_9STRA|nr:hypothetical protein TrLO_g11195 [Triparma laevis f. longispina]